MDEWPQWFFAPGADPQTVLEEGDNGRIFASAKDVTPGWLSAFGLTPAGRKPRARSEEGAPVDASADTPAESV